MRVGAGREQRLQRAEVELLRRVDELMVIMEQEAVKLVEMIQGGPEEEPRL